MKTKNILILSISGFFTLWIALKAFSISRKNYSKYPSSKDIQLLLLYKQRQERLIEKLDILVGRMNTTLLQVESNNKRVEVAYIDMFEQINEKLDSILNKL